MKFSTLMLASLIAVSPFTIAAEEQTTEAKASAGTEAVAAEEKAQSSDVLEQNNHEEIFKKLDQDGDEKISLKEAEISPALTKGFSKIDTNQDGFLSRDEFANLWARADQARARVAMASTSTL